MPVKPNRIVSTTSAVMVFLLAGVWTEAKAADVSDRFRDIERVSSNIYDALEDLWPEEPLLPGLKVQVGGGLGFSPEYKGSDDYDLSLVPVLRVQYKSLLVLTGYTLKVNAIHGETIVAGGLARYSSGRDQDNSPVLDGLGDVGSTIMVGPFIEYRMDPVRLFAEVRHALGAGQGTKLEFGARMGLYKSERWGVQAAATANWGSRKYTRTYFGVDEEQAASSLIGLPVYRPGGGFSEFSLSVGSRYKITDRTSFVNFIEYARLVGEVDDSPLVEAGSPNQFSGGLGILFSF